MRVAPPPPQAKHWAKLRWRTTENETKYWNSIQMPPPVTAHVAPIQITVDCPAQASTGDSFAVRVVLDLASVKDPDAVDALESMNLTLSGSGLEVKPDSAVKLTQVGQTKMAAWSARATTPGIYTLVLNSSGETSLGDMPTTVVKITPRWSSVAQKAWPYLCSFFGSLLSLPGILAYLKDRRTGRRPTAATGRNKARR